MKKVKTIPKTAALIITIFLSGCGLMRLEGETVGIFDNSVASVYVTTTPDKAKLNLVNIDRGIGAAYSTAFAPQTVHFTPLPYFGAFLMVSHAGYQTQTIRLDPGKYEMHVNLEPVVKKKGKCSALLTLSKAFNMPANLPDLSYVVEDEGAIPEAINNALTQELNYPPKDEDCSDGSDPSRQLHTAIVSIEELEYTPEAKQYTGKIQITSTPDKMELLLDGYLMGTTPVEIPVQSGYHRLVLRDSDDEVWSKQITISEKIEKRIDVNFPHSSHIAPPRTGDEGSI